MKHALKYLIFITFLGLFNSSLYGQDYHLSQYFASPLGLNPAMTGVFNGDIRFAGNYRDQWTGTAAFKTYAVSVDASMFKKKLNGSFWGGGILFDNDFFEDQLYSTSRVIFSGSFNQMLSNKPKHYLSAGAQIGYVERKISLSDLNFGTLWEENNNYDPGLSGYPGSISYIDISTGILWYSILNDRTDLYGGLSLFHITRPNQSFLNNDDSRLHSKMAIHGGAELRTGTKVSLLPTALFLLQGPSKETNFGSYIKYLLDKRGNNAFYGGAWMRLVGNAEKSFGSDAVILGTRLDVKGFTVGFSYDLDISKLSSYTKVNGGPELYIIYIAQIKKRKNGTRYCPGW